MSKAQKLRTALFGAGKDGMPRAECAKIVGQGGASNMIKTGEIKVIDVDGVSTFVLNPDYTPKRERQAGKAPQKKPKKATKRPRQAKHKRGRQPRTLKDIADSLQVRSSTRPRSKKKKSAGSPMWHSWRSTSFRQTTTTSSP